MSVLAFLFVFCVGAAGYWLLRKAHFPNPGMLGAMVSTGTLNLVGWYPSFATWPVSFAASVVIGIMLGRQITRGILAKIRKLALPVLVHTTGMLLLSLLAGSFLYHSLKDSGVSLATALVSGTAGGLAEMVLFGLSIHADVGVIAFIQLVRICLFLALIPYVLRLSQQTSSTSGADSSTATHLHSTSSVLYGLGRLCKLDKLDKSGEPDGPHSLMGRDKFTTSTYIPLILLAIAGAWAGDTLHVPAGAMLGSMLACGGFALIIGKEYSFDSRARLLAQIALGVIMGNRITPEMIALLEALVFPALLSTAIMLVGCVTLTFFMHKLTGLGLVTCFLCSAPAGLSQVILHADEAGADSLTATVFHTARLVGIVAFYPWIIFPFLH